MIVSSAKSLVGCFLVVSCFILALLAFPADLEAQGGVTCTLLNPDDEPYVEGGCLWRTEIWECCGHGEPEEECETEEDTYILTCMS